MNKIRNTIHRNYLRQELSNFITAPAITIIKTKLVNLQTIKNIV